MHLHCIILLLLVTTFLLDAQGREDSTICSANEPTRLEVRVYDKYGNALAFHVKEITIENSDVTSTSRTLIQQQLTNYKLKASHMSLVHYFLAMPMLQYRLRIRTDTNEEEMRIIDVVDQCVQRVDITHIDEVDVTGYGQTSHDSIIGSAAGCDFDDDWWVRAVRLIDEPAGPSDGRSFISSINSKGQFIIAGHFRTGLYGFIFGRGGVAVDIHSRTVTLRNGMAKLGIFSVRCDARE